MRKNLYKLHKLAGLTLGIFMFLLALSGILITFREELLSVVYEDFRVVPGEKELHPEIIIRNAQNYLGDRTVSNFYANGEADEASLILFKDAGKALPGILVINPFTGAVISEMPVWQNAFAVALFFHANFFLGKTGEWLVGILGFVLILFIFSGLIIWLPKKNIGTKLKSTFSGKFSSQKIHHQLGIILAIPLLVSALTGFLTIFDLSYYVMRGINGEAKRPEEASVVRSCNFENDMKALSLITPDMLKNLISIHLCGKKNAYVKVSYGLDGRHPEDGYARLVIDSETQSVIQNFHSGTDPQSWNVKRLIIYPLHSGSFFGMPGKIIVFIGGIGLMLIFLSGVILTATRARRNRKHSHETLNLELVQSKDL